MIFERKETADTDICEGRSLRSLPPVYAPSLVICHGKKYQQHTFCVPSDRSYYARNVPEMRGMTCDACNYGWLLLQSYFSRECYLFNPVTLNKINLPLLTHDSYNIAVLTSPPSDPNCVVMLFSEKENSCIFCRIGDTTWSEQDIERRKKSGIVVIKSYDSAISSNGKIYLFYFNGVAVIEVKDKYAHIEPYEIYTPLPSLSDVGRVTSHFLESGGEIFQICELSLGMSSIIQKLEVFKLDLATMKWLEVDNIGDMIFLLGFRNSVSVSASLFGGKGNCIYFFASGRTNLCCFDMDDGTMIMTLPCPTKFPQWAGPFWVVPDCLQVRKKVAVAEVTKHQVYKEEGWQWKDLQVDLLQLILQNLVLGDCIRFRLACKAWMTMTPSTRPFRLLNLSKPQSLPWLMSLPNKKNDACHFHQPIYTDSYAMNIPQLEGAVVNSAKFGWLLLTKDKRSSMFFFNPITMETITLPEIEDIGYCFVNISFSAPPTSSDCVVFGHSQSLYNSVYMLAYRKDENRWTPYFLDVPYTFIPSNCNPVFHGGVFYSLSKNGMIGIFDPNVTSNNDSWRLHLDVSVPDVSSSSIYLDSTRSFIVECDGEIFSVFFGYVGKPVSVYKLVNKKWIQVESLGGRVMFISHTASVLMPPVLKGTEDRIYLPRFKGNESIYYSLKSSNYHSFGEQDSSVDWIDTCEHWNCTWLQTQ